MVGTDGSKAATRHRQPRSWDARPGCRRSCPRPLPIPPLHPSLGASPECSRVLTVCGGCRPHPAGSYRVCSRTATGDAWPSETLASLPLPAGERGDNGINVCGVNVTWERRGDISKSPTRDQKVRGWEEKALFVIIKEDSSLRGLFRG